MLVLHDPALVDLARKERSPNRGILRRLFLQRAQVPGWWLSRVEGDEPAFEGERWLRGHLILPIRNTLWTARTDRGHRITITDDPVLGLTYSKEED